MALKAVNVHSFYKQIVVAVFLFAALLSAQSKIPAQSKKAPAPAPSAFDDQAASQMILQLSEALQGHSQKQFLALFDLDKMKNGALFKQQITSFYSQTDSIRVHMNLGEIATEDETTTFSINAEMEIEPSNGSAPEHQNEIVTFTVVNSGGWKFTDVQPRSFFSLP
jgi:hypothetical protein